MEDNNEVTLHYIDKLHISLQETGRNINYILIINIVLSFLTISLCQEIISVDKEGSLAGLKFTFNPFAVIYACAWIICIFQVYFLGLSHYEVEVRDSILRLYKSLSFEDASMADLNSNPLEFPNIYSWSFGYEYPSSSFINGFLKILGFLILVLITILPNIVEIIILYKFVTVFGWAWWILLTFAVIMPTIFGHLISFYTEMIKVGFDLQG